MTRPLVYVAGPITKPDPLTNLRAGLDVGAELLDSGLVVPFLPHLSCYWEVVTPRPYEEWLAYDFDVIRHCAALLRMPGVSAGADREVALAHDIGIPVFHGVAGLLRWAARCRGAVA